MTFQQGLASVYVTHRFVGFHSWPAAPEHRVYLAEPHRHVFHVKLTVNVPIASERNIEFHDLLDQLALDCDELRDRKLGSCESIARDLAERAKARYPKRRVECEVSEDGENGAVITFLP